VENLEPIVEHGKNLTKKNLILIIQKIFSSKHIFFKIIYVMSKFISMK